MAKPTNSNDLQSLPSIGPSLAQDLRDLGFRCPEDLHGQDPEKMFTDLKELEADPWTRVSSIRFGAP